MQQQDELPRLDLNFGLLEYGEDAKLDIGIEEYLTKKFLEAT